MKQRLNQERRFTFVVAKDVVRQLLFDKGRAVISDDRGHDIELSAEELGNLKELIDSAEKKGMP